MTEIAEIFVSAEMAIQELIQNGGTENKKNVYRE
jgi:hypothetical protein